MHNTAGGEAGISLVFFSQQLTREDPAMKGAPSSFAFSTIHSASCQLYELRHTAPRPSRTARLSQDLHAGIERQLGERWHVQVFVVEDGHGSAAGGKDAEDLLHKVLPREEVLPFLVPPEAWPVRWLVGWGAWGGVGGRGRTGNRHAPRS